MIKIVLRETFLNMEKIINLQKNEWFNIEKELQTDVQFYAITGGRGCGKTYSVLQYVKKEIAKGKKVLYIRNSKDDIRTATSYFQTICSENQVIKLGRQGAGSICICDTENKDDIFLIGYTLALADYESFKSAKKLVDIIIYEEFSTFKGENINRVFALVEILETIRQTQPNFLFLAISNNLYKDDLLDNLLDSNEFLHIQITKESIDRHFKNKTINAYLMGAYLVDDFNMNLSKYKCLGYILSIDTKIYLYYNDMLYPNTILSSSGTGGKIKIDMDVIKLLCGAIYRNLHERNSLEFNVGLLTNLVNKYRT